jgi:hypothetical protein
MVLYHCDVCLFCCASKHSKTEYTPRQIITYTVPVDKLQKGKALTCACYKSLLLPSLQDNLGHKSGNRRFSHHVNIAIYVLFWNTSDKNTQEEWRCIYFLLSANCVKENSSTIQVLFILSHVSSQHQFDIAEILSDILEKWTASVFRAEE